MNHLFCDEGIVVDLRFLVAAEHFDFTLDESAPDKPWGIGFILEVGACPHRLSAFYLTARQRDEAFDKLTAMCQAWMTHTHARDED